MSEQNTPMETTEELNTVLLIRREKLQKLIDMGVNPYPPHFEREQTTEQISNNYADFEKSEVVVAGRLMSIRRMGKSTFADLEDSSGRIQLYLNAKSYSEKDDAVFQLSDIGDVVGIKGEVTKTRTGEITIMVKEYTMLTKTLRPIPIVKEKGEGDEKITFDAFADKEMRYRQRYVD
ncbi:MAG: lysine--tRNA ligase, partial [Calditrichaeota bacterium]